MLSFDITDRNIRIIKGVENKNKISISSAATINIDEDIIVNGHVKDVPRLATIINQKLKQNRMSDKEAIVSISSNMTIFKELSLRRVQKEQEFTRMVKIEMQQKVGIDDSYAISYSIVEGAQDQDGMVTVLATACPIEVIDSYKRVFSMLSIPLRSVIIGCNCITKVLLSDERNRSKMPLLAVQIDNNFISLNIYENNQLSFSRFASIDPADYDNSADYVYEAVNENIFRMLQFHKSRNANEPIRNVILYGDTKEYIRITRDLEQMDINTSVIAVPKNVKGYQNLEFALYANAIGAMFSRNKATEKINLLEFGGTGSVISDKVKSDSSFGIIFAVCALSSLLVMGGITAALAIKDNNIRKEITMMEEFNNSSETAAKLAKRERRIALQDQVSLYQKSATMAADALSSQPFVESEEYKKIEEIIGKTVESANIQGLVYDPDYKNVQATFEFTEIDYSDKQISFGYTAPCGDKSAPELSSMIVKAMEDSGYFESVYSTGYEVAEVYKVPKDQGGKPERWIVSALVLDLKSPIDSSQYASLGEAK